MIYKNQPLFCELLDNGIYKGYHYYIISRGYFPLAYVEIPKKNTLFEKNYDIIDLPVNGGCTYCDSFIYTGYTNLNNVTKITGSWFIGWDYAHYNDYNAMFEDFNMDGKKWTTPEIIKECKKAIDYLKDYE